MPDLKIDPALRDYLPNVHDISDELLERSLKAEGKALDPITVWKQRNVIVDGHRRYTLCEKLGLPTPAIRYKDFKDINEVKQWMDETQRARRNLSTAEMAVKRAEQAKAKVKAGAKPSKAAQEVAEESGVTVRTVFRDQQFTEALEKLPRGIQNEIKSGSIEATKKEVTSLATLPKDKQLEVVQSVKDGEYKTLKEALGGESTDTMSVKKPPMDLFNDANRQLGLLKKAIDSLKPLGVSRHRGVMGLLDDSGSILESWKREST